MNNNKIKSYFIFLLLIITLFFIFLYSSKLPRDFEIAFIDVGQGNSVIIETENNKNVIIDSGREMYALQNASKYLGFFNRKFDLTFISHYDSDHSELFTYYFKNFKIGKVFESHSHNHSPLRAEIKKILESKGLKLESLKTGDKIEIDKDTKIEVLFPESFFSNDVFDENSTSLVLKVFYKKYTFLITGDLPSRFEHYLVQKYNSKLKSDVLMAGHHGSKTANSKEFLDVVQPKYIVISVGKDNTYHLPNTDVLQRFEKIDTKVLRTDEVGTVIFKVGNDNKLFYETQK